MTTIYNHYLLDNPQHLNNDIELLHHYYMNLLNFYHSYIAFELNHYIWLLASGDCAQNQNKDIYN